MRLCYIDHTTLTQSQILDFPVSGRSPLRRRRDYSAILGGGGGGGGGEEEEEEEEDINN